MRLKQDNYSNLLVDIPLPSAVLNREQGITSCNAAFTALFPHADTSFLNLFNQEKALLSKNCSVVNLQNKRFEIYVKATDENNWLISIGNQIESKPKESKLKQLFSSNQHIAVFSCSQVGDLHWTNKLFRVYFPLKPSTASLNDVFQTSVFESLLSLFKTLSEKQHQSIRLQQEDGEATRTFILEATLWSKDEADEATVICFMHDITEIEDTKSAMNLQLQQKEAILEAIPDMVFRVKDDGTYLSSRANNPDELLVPLDQMVGMNFHDMPESEELKQGVWKKIQSTLRDGKIRTAEYQRANLKGEIQFYEARLTRSGKDEVVYFVRNITERQQAVKQLSLSEMKWRSIVQNGFDGVLLCDAEGKVKFISSNVKKLLKLNPDDIEGRNLLEFISERNRPEVREIFHRLLDIRGKKIRQNLTIEITNRDPIEIEASMVNMLNIEGVEAVVINYRDISERLKFEEAILEANNDLNAVVENTSEMIWMMNSDRQYKTFNSAFAKAVKAQYDVTLYKNMPLAELKDEESIIFWDSIYNKIETSHKPEMFRMNDSNGRVYDVSINPIIARKRIKGFSAFASDVTDIVSYQNHIIEQQQTINTMLNTTSAAIMILDRDRVVYSNHRCAQLFGYANDEIQGMKVAKLIHPDERHQAQERVQMRSQGHHEVFKYEQRVITKDEVVLWVDVHSATIMYKGKNCIIATLNDITNLKNHEQYLVEAKEGAEELTRLKSTFLANMSHEIRTPLNGVLGLAELIESSENLDEIKEMVELQKQSGKRLLDTLTSILHLSRLESENNSVNVVRIHIANFLQELMDSFKPQYSKKGLYLKIEKVDPNWHCMADDIMLYQVFNNLLSNALKFTETGGVTISGELDPSEDSLLNLEVKDTGIGMSSEFLPFIFDSFRQESQGINRRYEGSGLGLAIAKKYLHLLSGDLVVSSTKGKGSTFTVKIPLRK